MYAVFLTDDTGSNTGESITVNTSIELDMMITGFLLGRGESIETATQTAVALREEVNHTGENTDISPASVGAYVIYEPGTVQPVSGHAAGQLH